METKREQSERSFDEKKRAYFSALAASVLSAMRLHKRPGNLWERNKEGKRDWGNVSEHCLVEVARVGVLAEKLGLSEEVRQNLKIAAGLHDFDKRSEILAMKEEIRRGGSGFDASNLSDEKAERFLRGAGFSENVIEIAGSVGGKSPKLFAIAELLKKEQLTDQDTARLVIHYVDGYTRGSDWTESVDRSGEEPINEVDRRVQKNKQNINYQKRDLESVADYDGDLLLRGRGDIENDALICHLAERRLVEIIAKTTGEKIEPLELPEIIDQEIKKKIEGVQP